MHYYSVCDRYALKLHTLRQSSILGIGIVVVVGILLYTLISELLDETLLLFSPVQHAEKTRALH